MTEMFNKGDICGHAIIVDNGSVRDIYYKNGKIDAEVRGKKVVMDFRVFYQGNGVGGEDALDAARAHYFAKVCKSPGDLPNVIRL